MNPIKAIMLETMRSGDSNADSIETPSSNFSVAFMVVWELSIADNKRVVPKIFSTMAFSYSNAKPKKVIPAIAITELNT